MSTPESLVVEADEYVRDIARELRGECQCTACSTWKPYHYLVDGLCSDCRCPVCGAKITQKGHLRDQAVCTDLDCGALLLLNVKTLKWYVAAYRDDDVRPCDTPGCLHTVPTSPEAVRKLDYRERFCATCLGNML